MALEPKETVNLREACVQAAHAVIAEQGVEGLSLRDVARRLNVSHQAPYKHYPSRDHLLAEVIRRCFERFARALNERTRHPDALADMHSLGTDYLYFALNQPLEYRLMFSTPWPSVADHPDLLRDARRAFGVLREALAPLYAQAGADADKVDADALFVWSSMHGLATILQSNAMQHLALSPQVLEDAANHVMRMVDVALMASSGIRRA
ncbi:MAG: TetR/AcrR family transcriptional regulator [Burkholderiaceae bacterium]